MSQWNRVEDELPIEDEYVLVYRSLVASSKIRMGFYSNERWYERNGARVIDVTHWSSLPEPPSEEIKK